MQIPLSKIKIKKIKRKPLLIYCFLLIIQIHAQAQNPKDPIYIRKELGTQFLQNGKKLNPRDLLKITRLNGEANKVMKEAKSLHAFGSTFGAAGGFLIGMPIGTKIAGGEPNWTLAGIGAGLVMISIPFGINYTKKTKNAVKIYNDGIGYSDINSISFQLGATQNGLALKMKF